MPVKKHLENVTFLPKMRFYLYKVLKKSGLYGILKIGAVSVFYHSELCVYKGEKDEIKQV